ncbi:hypothetical protein DES49_0967 [Halospina denitrificans]|uniref:Type I restriction enzyme R subunit n=1 Tax=Halospina denitrificans TaxID=332522 RepID=A0A4R7JZT1_9GAMM|nr:hypothetical protein DES49_0967 [Halospina denitrificans]
MDKKTFSERDICTKYITPAIEQAGWNIKSQVREEVSLTDGRVIVRGRMHTRIRPLRADYVLNYQKNQPIAVVEAKDNKHSLREQHEIVQKVDELMALCDRLKEHLSEADEIRLQLAEASIFAALK